MKRTQSDVGPVSGKTMWTIRRAVPEDARSLAICIDAAYASYRERIRDLPSVSEGLTDDIERNLVWVAELDRSIVGGLVLVLKDVYAILANVAVHPDCSGLGIGGGLIEHAESQCRKLNRGELRLSTHVAMPGNIRLYEHLGWRETGRSGSKVQMSKRL